MLKLIIFDFNGTLFEDDEIHVKIWQDLTKQLIDDPNEYDASQKQIGLINFNYIKSLNKYRKVPLSDEQAHYYSAYKEKLYRDYVREHNLAKLPLGAKEFLDFLKKEGYHLVLCTASIIENVEFFFSDFNLKEWFDFQECVYDDGTYRDKKMMYTSILNKYGVTGEEVAVFEDSKTGINAAIDANIKYIFAYNKDNHDNPKGVYQNFKDYRELPFNFFKK